MLQWLGSLIDPSFMPHGHCYHWRPDILWTHVLSDIAIGISYYLIPIALAIFLKKREDAIPAPELFALFIAFIFLCGTTHFMNIYVTWYPAYEYQGWLKALTAFASVLTALLLIPRISELIRLSTIEKAYQETQIELNSLKENQKQMDALFQTSVSREERIKELKQEVNNILIANNKPPQYDI